MSKRYNRVLVTGGAGFLGSEVTAQLIQRGYDVVVADDLSNPQSHPRDDYTFHKIDMGDKAAAKKAFDGVDAVIALASRRGAIGYVFRHPTDIIANNNRIFNGTFENCVEAKVKRLVFISSSMIYEAAKTYPTKESEVLGLPIPISYFGFSKFMGEQYCRAFHQQYNLEYTIIRPSNIYGPDEMPGEKVGDSHVIPDFMKKIETQGGPVEILGNGKQTRCFIHVRDIARGVVTALESEKAANEDFNMGAPREVQILELARLIWKEFGMKGEFKATFVGSFPQDVKRQFMDTSKAKQMLGWESTVSFEDGLKEIVAEYRKRQSA